MSSVYRLSTYSDLQTYVRQELKVQTADSDSLTKIKRALNAYYLNEVAPKSNWWWLRKKVDVVTEPAFYTGTAAVDANSTTVTLTESPTDSKTGWLFCTNQYNEIYRVRSHVAGSDTLVLETPYMGTTDGDLRYTLWTEEVYLPTDCRETFEVNHDYFDEPLEGTGFQDFRATAKIQPRNEGYPQIYTQDDYVVPDSYAAIDSLPTSSTKRSEGLLKYVKFASTLGSGDSALLKAGDRIDVTGSSDAEHYDGQWIVQAIVTTSTANDTVVYATNKPKKSNFAADTGISIKLLDASNEYKRLKKLRIYPSILKSKLLLHIDYIQMPPAMENDSDAPLMPTEDRIVLAYGALSQLWSSIGRNPEEAKRNFDLAQNKLTEMMNRYSDSVDFPRLVVSQGYLALKRMKRNA